MTPPTAIQKTKKNRTSCKNQINGTKFIFIGNSTSIGEPDPSKPSSISGSKQLGNR